MTNRHFLTAWTPMLAIAAAMMSPCLAQDDNRGHLGLTGIGQSTIQLQPAFLQMTIQLEGSSSDLTQAAEEVAARVQVARERLQTLGALADTITISPAKMKSDGGGNSEQERMQQMMAQYGGGRRGREMLESTQSVSVVQTIVARWDLPDADSTERLVQTRSLIEKIEGADVGSTQRAQPVSPAQEELAVEMEAMADQYNYDETPTVKPGTPSFSYVAVLDDPTHASAIKSAFDDAKATIELLAKSTGQTIGSVRPQSMQVTPGSGEMYNRYGNPAAVPTRNPITQAMEITSTDAAETSVTVRVHAAADLR